MIHVMVLFDLLSFSFAEKAVKEKLLKLYYYSKH